MDIPKTLHFDIQRTVGRCNQFFADAKREHTGGAAQVLYMMCNSHNVLRSRLSRDFTEQHLDLLNQAFVQVINLGYAPLAKAIEIEQVGQYYKYPPFERAKRVRQNRRAK